MINLTTPNDSLFRELMADKDKAHYWLVKKNGGDKSYEKMRNKLLQEAKKHKRTQISEVVEYRSANGNRWITYECARYFPQTDSVYTAPYAFCFYETIGSAGAFMPVKIGMNGMDGVDAIVIFTSHFFYQMSERLGLGYRSPELTRAFHEYIPSLLMKTYVDEEDGNKTKIAIRLPGSIGWGFQREGDKPVFEVRTFLSDVQLNGKQKRITQELRANSDKFAFEPASVQSERIKQMVERGESLGSEVQRIKDKYAVMGVDGQSVEDLLDVSLWVVTIFTKMGLATADDDKFWERHAKVNSDIINDYVATAGRDSEKLLDLVEACAKNDGIRNFDREKAKAVYAVEAEKVLKR